MFSSIILFFAASVTLPVCEVVEKPDMSVSTYPGRVVPIAQVNVVPQVSGEILEVCFENGAMVKEGDVLYRLDPVKYSAAVKNAEAKLAECKANLSYAELSYARHKKLLETRAVSLDVRGRAGEFDFRKGQSRALHDRRSHIRQDRLHRHDARQLRQGRREHARYDRPGIPDPRVLFRVQSPVSRSFQRIDPPLARRVRGVGLSRQRYEIRRQGKF